MRKAELIDFLRGFIIFSIVLMHLCQGYTEGVLNKVFAWGAGVHVFILCSGFGLFLSYLRKSLDYKDFLRKMFANVCVLYAIDVLMWSIWLISKNGVFLIREVTSHLLLYKMFSVELDTSLCYPCWFISTIIQFYLAWPLIVRPIQHKGGYFIALTTSLAWSTLVGFLGNEEMQPWRSICGNSV